VNAFRADFLPMPSPATDAAILYQRLVHDFKILWVQGLNFKSRAPAAALALSMMYRPQGSGGRPDQHVSHRSRQTNSGT
jgi:hypothetical protein